MRPVLTAILVVPLLLAFAGCGGEEAPPAHGDADEHAADTHEHGHSHEPPHGGALVAIGDHFAHLEVVLDAEAGRITLYVLDGHAESGRRVGHESLTLRVSQVDGERQGFTLTLAAVASALTGETVGDSSQFAGEDERLVGADRFVGELASITIRGETFEEIDIHYPQGAE